MKFDDPLFKNFSNSLAWTVSQNSLRIVLGTTLSLILARLLLPTHYGLIGMVTVVTNFFAFTNNFGLNALIIKRKNIDQGFLSTVLWLNLVTGVIVFFMIVALAPAIAYYYSESRLASITIGFSSLFIVQSLAMVPESLLRRDFNFKPIAIISIVSILVGGSTAIILAYLGFGVWSLIANELLAKGLGCVLFFAKSKWLPSLTFETGIFRELLSFSMNMTGNKIAGYITRNIDFFVVASFLGPAALGFYTLAFRLAVTPTRRLSSIFGKVLLPIYSKIQDDDKLLADYFFTCSRVVLTCSFPLFCLFLFFPHLLISVLLGEKWLPSAYLLQICSVLVLFEPLHQLVYSVFIVKGKQKLLLRVSSFYCALLVPALLIAGFWANLNLIVGIYVLIYVALGATQVFLGIRLINQRFLVFLRTILREYMYMIWLLLLCLLAVALDTGKASVLTVGLSLYISLIAFENKNQLVSLFSTFFKRKLSPST